MLTVFIPTCACSVNRETAPDATVCYADSLHYSLRLLSPPGPYGRLSGLISLSNLLLCLEGRAEKEEKEEEKRARKTEEKCQKTKRLIKYDPRIETWTARPAVGVVVVVVVFGVGVGRDEGDGGRGVEGWAGGGGGYEGSNRDDKGHLILEEFASGSTRFKLQLALARTAADET